MTNFSELRVFLCMTPTSMSFSFDRLMGMTCPQVGTNH